MFAQLIRKGRWTYMFLAAAAVLAVAALTTLASTRNAGSPTENMINHEQGQAAYSNYTHNNGGATMHFVN